MIPFPEGATIRDLYEAAVKITDQQEADEYLESLVHWSVDKGMAPAEAELLHRRNLGYYAGYYDNETMRRVNRLFRTTHPVFGGV